MQGYVFPYQYLVDWSGEALQFSYCTLFQSFNYNNWLFSLILCLSLLWKLFYRPLIFPQKPFDLWECIFRWYKPIKTYFSHWLFYSKIHWKLASHWFFFTVEQPKRPKEQPKNPQGSVLGCCFLQKSNKINWFTFL